MGIVCVQPELSTQHRALQHFWEELGFWKPGKLELLEQKMLSSKNI